MHSCGLDVKVSRMYSCVLELLRDLPRKGEDNGMGKDRASGRGHDHARTIGQILQGGAGKAD